jgi:aryl-phospho-beta-D-glucosidase BglC (GH1 family)
VKKIIKFFIALFIINLAAFNASGAEGLTDMDFLKANGRDLRNNHGNGDIVILRGTNVGGFLLQEFWMTPTSYTANAAAETDLYRILTERFGKETKYDLVALYQASYFTEEDFDRCVEMGINCLRLPFWYRNLVDENGRFYENGFDSIDWFIEEAGKRGIYVILDMHGAPGSQNGSDHSGKDGGNNKEAASEFFFGPNAAENQEIFYKIWEAVAQRYKDNPAVAGYDLLNEPYCTYRYSSSRTAEQLNSALWRIYDNAYKRIRAVDPDHLIIMEAVWDPSDLPDPSGFGWTNIMYQYHNYAQGTIQNLDNARLVVDHMRAKVDLIANAGYNVPSYMGEFNFYGNMNAWDEGLAMFNERGLNWTAWTYKTTRNNGSWGLYHHSENRSVNLETDSIDRIREIWQNAGAAVPNTQLINVVSKYLNAEVTANNLIPQQADMQAGDYYFTGFNTRNIISVGDNSQLFTSDRRFTESDNQIFTLLINADATFSLMSKHTGKYVSVNAPRRLHADADAISDSEKFYIYQQGAHITIKSLASGRYVCADENLSGTPLIADRASASSWEQFSATLIADDSEESENAEDAVPGVPGTESGEPDQPKKNTPNFALIIGGVIAAAFVAVSGALTIRSVKKSFKKFL